MKRYLIQTTLGITAKSEEEAKRIIKEIIESGNAKGSTDTAIAYAVLDKEPIVIDELPF